jgi:hypothetical protein
VRRDGRSCRLRIFLRVTTLVSCPERDPNNRAWLSPPSNGNVTATTDASFRSLQCREPTRQYSITANGDERPSVPVTFGHSHCEPSLAEVPVGFVGRGVYAGGIDPTVVQTRSASIAKKRHFTEPGANSMFSYSSGFTNCRSSILQIVFDRPDSPMVRCLISAEGVV